MASARKKSKLRNPLNPAVQAGFRRTASRRAEPLPTLSHAKQTPARSDNSKQQQQQRHRIQADARSDRPKRTGHSHQVASTDNPNSEYAAVNTHAGACQNSSACSQCSTKLPS